MNKELVLLKIDEYINQAPGLMASSAFVQDLQAIRKVVEKYPYTEDEDVVFCLSFKYRLMAKSPIYFNIMYDNYVINKSNQAKEGIGYHEAATNLISALEERNETKIKEIYSKLLSIHELLPKESVDFRINDQAIDLCQKLIVFSYNASQSALFEDISSHLVQELKRTWLNFELKTNDLIEFAIKELPSVFSSFVHKNENSNS